LFITQANFRDYSKIDVVGHSLSLNKIIEFQTHLKKHITEGRHKLVIDLTELSYVDSSFMNAILQGYQLLPPGGKICLVVNNHEIQRVIELIGLPKIISVYPSLEMLLKSENFK